MNECEMNEEMNECEMNEEMNEEVRNKWRSSKMTEWINEWSMYPTMPDKNKTITLWASSTLYEILYDVSYMHNNIHLLPPIILLCLTVNPKQLSVHCKICSFSIIKLWSLHYDHVFSWSRDIGLHENPWEQKYGFRYKNFTGSFVRLF